VFVVCGLLFVACCLVFGVWCLVFGVWCLVASLVWRLSFVFDFLLFNFYFL
jgi:hypothetical protein